MKIQLKSNRMR